MLGFLKSSIEDGEVGKNFDPSSFIIMFGLWKPFDGQKSCRKFNPSNLWSQRIDHFLGIIGSSCCQWLVGDLRLVSKEPRKRRISIDRMSLYHHQPTCANEMKGLPITTAVFDVTLEKILLRLEFWAMLILRMHRLKIFWTFRHVQIAMTPNSNLICLS